jgi:hypothetical protein
MLQMVGLARRASRSSFFAGERTARRAVPTIQGAHLVTTTKGRGRLVPDSIQMREARRDEMSPPRLQGSLGGTFKMPPQGIYEMNSKRRTQV